MNSNFITIERHSRIPAAARKLIWNVFFSPKQRGINLEHHFPWITDESVTTCITISDTSKAQSTIVATLVIKEEIVDPLGLVGLIGLVCVDQQQRGRGYSSSLVRRAINVGLEKSWSALILWTSKPDLYRGMDFNVSDIDEYGAVSRHSTKRKAAPCKFTIQDLREYGIPAFATGIQKFIDGSDFLVICNTRREPTLVDWSKEMQETLRLIDCILPDLWNVNIPKDSPLVSCLLANGYSVNLTQGAIRMVRKLKAIPLNDIPYIGLLNRI